jgi:hypothetical protein
MQRSFSLVLLYAGVFWSGWLLADTIGGDRVSDTLLGIAVAVFIAGVVGFFLTEDTLIKGRYRGVLENPNAVGMLAVLFVPLAIARFIRKRSAASAVVIALMLGSLAMSGSRNGVLAVCFAVVFMMCRIRAWRTGLFFGAVFAIAFLAMPDGNRPADQASTPLSRLVATDQLASAGGRIEAWQVAIPIIRAKIALGHGFGTEDLIFRDMKFAVHRGLYIHNSYLGAAYQLGAAGALLLFIPLILLFLTRLLMTSRPPAQIAAYEAVLLGGLLASLFESWIYSAGNAFSLPFWITVMLLVRVAEFERQERSRATFANNEGPLYRPTALPRPAALAAAAPPRHVRRFDPRVSG